MKRKQEKVEILIDSKEKKKAEKVFDDLGLDFQTAVSIFIHRCVREKRIPFEYEIPNKETIAAFKEAEEMAKDPNHKSFNTVEEALAYLRKGTKIK